MVQKFQLAPMRTVDSRLLGKAQDGGQSYALRTHKSGVLG